LNESMEMEAQIGATETQLRAARSVGSAFSSTSSEWCFDMLVFRVGMPSTTKQKIMYAPLVPFLSLRGSLTKNEGQLQQNWQLDPTIDARNVWRTAVSDADCGRRSKNE
jgi:hypothetical protein